jgi:metal-responsive CopG/Arc/MetJ family transcriptional regulator
MSVLEDRVSVTLPRELVERVDELARKDNATREHELEALLDSGLRNRLDFRERMERLSEGYCARLAAEGRAEETAEQILAKLRELREQTAQELYPD